jgi:hypothetical protein
MKRREIITSVIKASGAIMVTGVIDGIHGRAWAQTPAQEEDPLAENPGSRAPRLIDEEFGDPDAEPESLNVNRSMLEDLLIDALSRGIRKDPRKIALKQLEIAHSYVGVSRTSNPDQVNQFLKLFKYRLRYPNGNYVPYCAVGVSFCACKAYCMSTPKQVEFNPDDPNQQFRIVLSDIKKYYFKPSPSCRDMVNNAKSRNIWVPRREISWSKVMPGWLVMFDWNRVGRPNHVGLVDRSLKTRLKTVEFNTSITINGSKSNGGAVASKERDLQYVLGYIKTY